MAGFYATSAFANQLGISKTTLHHYITILEEHGYEVSRNSRMHRQYTEEDLLIVRAFLTLYKQRGLKLKDAALAVTSPSFEPTHVLEDSPQIVVAPSETSMQSIKPEQYEGLSKSMELIASHIYGIEQQNAQLLALIEEQRTQNELLLDQNKTLKQQFGVMMNHIVEQSQAKPAQIEVAPIADQQRHFDRLEQQNNAIMSVLNKLMVVQNEQAPPSMEQEKQKGFIGKLFK